jgi:hypothetical protein
MVGEGIEYDQVHDRLVVGSMATGAVRGVPNSASRGVRLTEMETFTYFLGGGTHSISAIVGLKADPANACWLWAAVKSDPIGEDTL